LYSEVKGPEIIAESLRTCTTPAVPTPVTVVRGDTTPSLWHTSRSVVGMPPSWSAVERGDPPPRRKSCGACIKSKRRCSQDVPTCLRCQQRRIECNYTGAHTPKHRSPKDPALLTPTSSTMLTVLSPRSASDHTPPAEDPQLFVSPAAVTRASPSPYPQWSTSSDQAPESEGNQPHTDPASSSQLPLETSVGGTSRLVVAPLSHSTAQISDMVTFAMRFRLQYALDKMSFAVNQMVLECSTPWSHQHLYREEMPRDMQGTDPYFP